VKAVGGATCGAFAAAVVACRGADVGVPGEGLDGDDAGAGVEQLADEGAPQIVRGDGPHACALGERLQPRPDVRGGHTPPPA